MVRLKAKLHKYYHYSVQTRSCNVEHTVKRKTFFYIFRFLINACIMHGIHSLALCPSTSGFTGTFSIQEAPDLLFLHDDFKHLLCLISCNLMLREKRTWATPYSLSPPISNPSFLAAAFLKNLCEIWRRNTYAVTGFAFCILTCRVPDFYNLQSICNSIVCFLTLYINNSSDTAVIMFKFRAVETLLLISFLLPHIYFHPFYLQLLLPFFCQLPPAQIPEHRMCMVRSGFEFRMSLCSYKERMSGNFDHLNDMCIQGKFYDGHSFFT